jgi:hypothetical protein
MRFKIVLNGQLFVPMGLGKEEGVDVHLVSDCDIVVVSLSKFFTSIYLMRNAIYNPGLAG